MAYQNNNGNYNAQNCGNYGNQAPSNGGYRPQGNGSSGSQPQGNSSYGNQPQGNSSYGNQPQGNGSYGNQPQGNSSYGNQSQGNGGYGNQPQGNDNCGNQPKNNGGFNDQSRNQTNGQGQQDRVNWTPAIYEMPASGRMEDLCMTLVLGINTTQSLFFDKFLSRNGNICVGVSAEVVLGDKLVSEMFGPAAVRPDHTVSLQFAIAGYAADGFLRRVPNCTKNLVVMLKNFSMSSFNRRDGSQGMQIHANCVGLQVVHSSSRYKPAEVKNCNLQPSAPFTVRDKTNGAVPQQGSGNYNGQNQNASEGYGQYGYNAQNQAVAPGVTTFNEMDDDEELPF